MPQGHAAEHTACCIFIKAIIYKIFNEPIVLLGFAGQACFFLRFLIQWIISEKKHESVVPPIFWFISFAGAVIVFIYGWIVAEQIIVVGQLVSSLIYIRNLVLIHTNAKGDFTKTVFPTETEINGIRTISEINNEIKRLESNGQKNEAKILRWVLIGSSETR